ILRIELRRRLEILCRAIVLALLHGDAPDFFFNDPATTEIYTLSLHDALPISISASMPAFESGSTCRRRVVGVVARSRSEEHTSELQSRSDLVCRLLLEKK